VSEAERLDRETFDDYLRKQMEDPEFMKGYLHARKVMDRTYQVLCPWGRCEYSIDPVDNTIVTSIGPLGCGCDYFPGWKSKYYDGLPMPGFAVKPYGRHGSRIARKRKITAQHERWLDELVDLFTQQ
jgi:hypothetical protein